MAVIQKSDDTWKIAALLASTTDVPINSVLPIIDGVQTQHGNRVLLKNQTDPTENGIYVVQSMTLVKDSDNNVAWAFVNGGIVRVLGGSTNVNTEWYIAPIAAADYPTASKIFTASPFGGGGTTYTASNGLTMVGSDIQFGGSLTAPVTIDAAGSNTLSITDQMGLMFQTRDANGNFLMNNIGGTATLNGSNTYIFSYLGDGGNTFTDSLIVINFGGANHLTRVTDFWNFGDYTQATDSSGMFNIGRFNQYTNLNTATILGYSNNVSNGSSITVIGSNNVISAESNKFFLGNNNKNLVIDGTSGNVGIGTSTPSYKLDISSTSPSALRVSTVATYNDALIESDHYSASLSINAVTTSPIGGYNTGLYLNSFGVRRGSFNSESTTSVTTLESANGYWLLLKNSTTESIGLGQGGNYIQFGTNGTTKMLIDGVSGNVGIGTLSATSKLTVVGGTHLQLNDTVFRVDIGGSAGQVLFYRNADISFMMNPYPSAFNTSFRFLSNPAGTSYEAGIEHTVKGVLNANSGNVIGEVLNIGSTGSFTGNIYGKYIQKSNYLNTNATFYPLVAMGGNVGIGTTTPTALLEVNGDIKTAQPSANGAGAWKLGKKVTATVSLVTTDYIEVDIDGVVYKLALVS